MSKLDPLPVLSIDHALKAHPPIQLVKYRLILILLEEMRNHLLVEAWKYTEHICDHYHDSLLFLLHLGQLHMKLIITVEQLTLD